MVKKIHVFTTKRTVSWPLVTGHLHVLQQRCDGKWIFQAKAMFANNLPDIRLVKDSTVQLPLPMVWSTLVPAEDCMAWIPLCLRHLYELNVKPSPQLQLLNSKLHPNGWASVGRMAHCTLDVANVMSSIAMSPWKLYPLVPSNTIWIRNEEFKSYEVGFLQTYWGRWSLRESTVVWPTLSPT